MAESGTLTCPCCGYKMISGTYEICEICAWENDPAQSQHPDISGANRVTLREAQQNFRAHGAAELRFSGTDYVRPPAPTDCRDPNWRPLNL